MRQRKDSNIQIGANIQQAREHMSYTQEHLSEMVGMTPNHLSAIERGVSGVSLESLQKICLALDVSADAILFGDTDGDDEAAMLTRQIMELTPESREKVKKILREIVELLHKD